MKIKVSKNGVTSDWFENTKKIHRKLLLNQPDQVTVHLHDIYPSATASDQIIEVPFVVFNVITREAVLEESCYKKRCERHHDARSIELLMDKPDYAVPSAEEVYQHQETIKSLQIGQQKLTPTQYTRLWMYLDGYTLREIAHYEGVGHTAIEDSIRAALHKLKEFL